MLKRSLMLIGLAALVGCSEQAQPTAVIETEIANAPTNNNKGIFSAPSGAAFAIYGPEFVEVCLVLPTDDPGNGDFVVLREEDGVVFFQSQSSTSEAQISVFATVDDYLNGGEPYAVAQGHGVENRRYSRDGSFSAVFRGQGKTEDGQKVMCSATFPSGKPAIRSISVR